MARTACVVPSPKGSGSVQLSPAGVRGKCDLHRKRRTARPLKKVPVLRAKLIVNLFFENSTRTRSSFEIAEKRLSADTLNFSASTSSVSKGESLVDTIQNMTNTGEILLGTDSHTCTAYTSDFAYIENVRTYDKALRNLNAAYLGPLGSPITLQSNGTLTNASVAYFEGVGETVLNAMTSGNPNSGLPELSAYSVAISPSQDVLATSNILVTISCIPTGSARTFTINLSFAASIAS